MKLSTILLIAVGILLTLGLVASNYLFKAEYNKIDKTDKYWYYSTLSEKPFKHIVIKGGYKGNVVFEPNTASLVKINNWDDADLKKIKVSVVNDTLSIQFPDTFLQEFINKYRDKPGFQIIRILAPELVSITEINGQLICKNMVQENYSIRLLGKSDLEIQSVNHQIANINLLAQDSSEFKISKSENAKQNISINNSKTELKDCAKASFSTSKINQFDLRLAEHANIELSGYNLNKLASAN
jgi:hypothetical protein